MLHYVQAESGDDHVTSLTASTAKQQNTEFRSCKMEIRCGSNTGHICNIFWELETPENAVKFYSSIEALLFCESIFPPREECWRPLMALHHKISQPEQRRGFRIVGTLAIDSKSSFQQEQCWSCSYSLWMIQFSKQQSSLFILKLA
jgi:hypothetical protein